MAHSIPEREADLALTGEALAGHADCGGRTLGAADLVDGPAVVEVASGRTAVEELGVPRETGVAAGGADRVAALAEAAVHVNILALVANLATVVELCANAVEGARRERGRVGRQTGSGQFGASAGARKGRLTSEVVSMVEVSRHSLAATSKK